TTAPAGYARRAAIAVTTKDCNSSDAAKFKNYVGYVDADGDGYGSTALQQLFCSGNTFENGTVISSGVDCNDANANVFTERSAATDADQDSFSIAEAATTCAGASTVVSGRTYYKNTSGNYAFLDAAGIAGSSDCNDANANIYQNVSVATDVDQDGYSTAAAASTCVGASSTVSGRTYYVDSAGAVTKAASASIIAQPDCDDADALVGLCPIPSGVIIAWPGTNASIPSGWTRVTSMDDRYSKGAAAGVEPNVTGGAATHTHTSPVHSHSIPSHSHASNSNLGSANFAKHYSDEDIQRSSRDYHVHTVGTSSSTGGTSSEVAATWQTVSNDPSYVGVIFIESDGTTAGIPDGAWAWWSNEALPTNWTQPAAAKSKYLKGASAAGNGGTTGGGTSHAHTASSHAHSTNHTHSVTSGVPTVLQSSITTGEQSAGSDHTHTVTFASGGNDAAQTSASTGTATGVEPPYKILAVIQNGTGGLDWPTGIIGMWLGSLASIPSGWQLCDGTNSTPDMRGLFTKSADALGGIGGTGGSLGHDHTDPAAHSHTVNHVHSYSTGGGSTNSNSGGGYENQAVGVGWPLNPVTHTHSGGSSSAAGTTSGTGTQTVDETADTQPPFRTVAYICKT
ncbi:MAG: hypothetical protein WD972_03345, partial [Candidatus Andersenbacteria bacterium]